MTIILAKQEAVDYFKLSYVLHDSLVGFESRAGGLRWTGSVDKCDSTVSDRVWLFSTFSLGGSDVYDAVTDRIIRPLKHGGLNQVMGIVEDIKHITEGFLEYKVLILDEFNQGDMVEIWNGKARRCDKFVSIPGDDVRREVEVTLEGFRILSYFLNADFSGLRKTKFYKGSGADKIGLKGRILWSSIEFMQRWFPGFTTKAREASFNNNIEKNLLQLAKVMREATIELAIAIKRVLNNIEDPLEKKFDFPLYIRYMVSSFNNGYLQNYLHNMNSPMVISSDFKLLGKSLPIILKFKGQDVFKD